MEELERLKMKAMKSKDPRFEDAKRIWEIGQEKPFYVIANANEIREPFKGKRISLCMIVNAKSGLCSEDCKFCAQSVHHETDVKKYPLLGPGEILTHAVAAKKESAENLGLVTSGLLIDSEKEWETIFASIRAIKGVGLEACASLGLLDRWKAVRLKVVGLYRYHHNLETPKSFFKTICTMHGYGERIETVKEAKKGTFSLQ
ncbi:MAG: hypothetical protein QXJ58_05090 [Archaeoglobaceae archaeon]